jgi:nitrogen regulatory protein PII
VDGKTKNAKISEMSPYGNPGVEKVFVVHAEDVLKIRTNEHGEEVI